MSTNKKWGQTILAQRNMLYVGMVMYITEMEIGGLSEEVTDNVLTAVFSPVCFFLFFLFVLFYFFII